MNTAPTRAAVEKPLMYPLQYGTPAERARFHIDNAVHFVSLAGNAISAFAIHAASKRETAAYGMASAGDTCAWNLESAEWHLSQIPAAYR